MILLVFRCETDIGTGAGSETIYSSMYGLSRPLSICISVCRWHRTNHTSWYRPFFILFDVFTFGMYNCACMIPFKGKNKTRFGTVFKTFFFSFIMLICPCMLFYNIRSLFVDSEQNKGNFLEAENDLAIMTVVFNHNWLFHLQAF